MKKIALIAESFISPILIRTLIEARVPVYAKAPLGSEVQAISRKEALRILSARQEPLVYSNAEDVLPLIFSSPGNDELKEGIRLFKDKARLNELLEGLEPKFFSVELDREELLSFQMPPGKKLIVKPAIGFLSLGVRRIDSQGKWQDGIKAILKELDSCKGMFDESVLRDDRFIVEDYIFGEEYACDGYFDKDGRPVIMLICRHLFRDEKDSRDVVYYTDVPIMQRLLPRVSRFMASISEKKRFSRFPFHFEFRVMEGEIHAIEINPMRFGGFGLADLSFFAFGVNSYSHFFEQKQPDWSAILNATKKRCYAFVLGRVPPQAKALIPDHLAFKAGFRSLLDYGIIDHQRYPAFCRVLAEGDSPEEFEKYLELDFSAYFH